MKFRFLIVILIFVSALSIKGQDQVQTGLKVFAGPTTPILDNGIGIQSSLNPHIDLSDYISLEVQLSYNTLRVSGSFLSGERGNVRTGSIFGGGRIYFTKPDKVIRPYANLLWGAFSLREVGEQNGVSTETGTTLSAGLFTEINKWTVGFSFEGPQFVMLKVGFQIL